MKVFIASFTRSDHGKVFSLIQELKAKDMYTNNSEKADYVLAVGDRKEIFDCVVDMYRQNKIIIHLWAGERCDWTTHDDAYRHAITLMSDIQLCTSDAAKEVVKNLCKSVGKKYITVVVGNICIDNLETSNKMVPDYKYDLVLYNPPTRLSDELIQQEIDQILELIKDRKYIWIEPNDDDKRELILPYATQETLPRDQFLGLVKNCNKFITNSSCQDSEAQYIMDKKNIIQIGRRNASRQSKYVDQSTGGAIERIIKLLSNLQK